MTVVADTSLLNYLIVIGAVELLPALYGSVHTPPACAAELLAPRAPKDVRRWFEDHPNWLTVTAPRKVTDPRMSHLDLGEEAIAHRGEPGKRGSFS
jgi:predicted nucleic acid-binding protein